MHVYPVDDTYQHDLETLKCECNPRIEFYDPDTLESYEEPLVIHNASDGRD